MRRRLLLHHRLTIVVELLHIIVHAYWYIFDLSFNQSLSAYSAQLVKKPDFRTDGLVHVPLADHVCFVANCALPPPLFPVWKVNTCEERIMKMISWIWIGFGSVRRNNSSPKRGSAGDTFKTVNCTRITV